MSNYKNQRVLAATPAAVYAALTTPQGLQGWWTHSCDVATHVGGKTTFRFGRTHKVLQNIKLVPDREVFWHCVEANIEIPGVTKKDEWVGTDMVFKLTPVEGGKTRLDFEHIGLTPAFECYEQCEGGWNLFLGSLQSLVETGEGTPHLAEATSCSSA